VSETLLKLSPHRDLQCFFFRPSAIAAFSETGPGGFKVTGSWRQQFDWAVVEWIRDNVYEHPLLRYLPDGDLSGLTLSYRERRTNCILMDSKLVATVDWPDLRIWAENASGEEQIYYVRLKDHATPVEGEAVAAQATFVLTGTLTAGDLIELSWLHEHFNHVVTGSDTVASVLADLTYWINEGAELVTAEYSEEAGAITLTHKIPGVESNWLGIIGTVSAAQTEIWDPPFQTMSGGASPTQWQVDLDFGDLQDKFGATVPTDDVRKMRWTYAAALQPGDFERVEFDVEVSDWTVGGTHRSYSVASPRSRRFEDRTAIDFTGSWTMDWGSFFSDGTIHSTDEGGDSASLTYTSQVSHHLFLGSRYTRDSGIISVVVDEEPALEFDLYRLGEDFVARLDLGVFEPGTHAVTATLTGQNPLSEGAFFYVDYIEEAIEAAAVDPQPIRSSETLATDWDTDHSLVLAPERVAWNLHMLGFKGRANHYAGAILFYELTNPENVYAEGTVTFEGTPEFGEIVEVTIGETVLSRVTLTANTNEIVAKAFEFIINNGSTGVWASSSGNVLTIHSRLLGLEGDSIALAASRSIGSPQPDVSGEFLSGGHDGPWLTDTSALPRLNRAARDWHRSYFAALEGYGIDATAALSMELSHGDRSPAAGLAQRYPNGDAVVLNTPAVQTNFSPTSLDFWKQAYLELADLQAEAGFTPYLQFGEVQWWFFPGTSGMTFYDDFTKAEFEAQYSRALHTFLSNEDSIEDYPEEAEFLPGLIGNFTASIRSFVRASHPTARFEVLYPHDTNDHALTRVVNFPESDWTNANFDSLKTENFEHTGAANLNKALTSIRLPLSKGFPRSKAAHLIGVSRESPQPWEWERRLARAESIESIVLWAFDQFSMVGYPLPLLEGVRRSRFIAGR